jgi:serine/threonine protein kinase
MLPLLDAETYGVVAGSPDHAAQMSILTREAQQLHAHRHMHVVEFLGVVADVPPPPSPPDHSYGRCAWMMMEMAELGSLDDCILGLRRRRAAAAAAGDGDASAADLMPLSQLLQLFVDALSGVAHLHAAVPPVMHRDLKPANLVVFPRARVPAAAADRFRCGAASTSV